MTTTLVDLEPVTVPTVYPKRRIRSIVLSFAYDKAKKTNTLSGGQVGFEKVYLDEAGENELQRAEAVGEIGFTAAQFATLETAQAIQDVLFSFGESLKDAQDGVQRARTEEQIASLRAQSAQLIAQADALQARLPK